MISEDRQNAQGGSETGKRPCRRDDYLAAVKADTLGARLQLPAPKPRATWSRQGKKTGEKRSSGQWARLQAGAMLWRKQLNQDFSMPWGGKEGRLQELTWAQHGKRGRQS